MVHTLRSLGKAYVDLLGIKDNIEFTLHSHYW